MVRITIDGRQRSPDAIDSTNDDVNKQIHDHALHDSTHVVPTSNGHAVAVCFACAGRWIYPIENEQCVCGQTWWLRLYTMRLFVSRVAVLDP